MNQRNPYQPAGTLSGESYISRKADQELQNKIEQNHFFPFMLASRQSGKSSVLAYTKKILSNRELLIALIDISTLPAKAILEEDEFLWFFICTLIDNIGIKQKIFSKIRTLKGEALFFNNALKLILASIDNRLVICIDEIDLLRKCEFKDQFLSKVRWIFNERSQDHSEYKNVQFVLAGATPVEKLISDPNRSPFNVGYRIILDDFGFDRVYQLVSLGWTQPEKAIKKRPFCD